MAHVNMLRRNRDFQLGGVVGFRLYTTGRYTHCPAEIRFADRTEAEKFKADYLPYKKFIAGKIFDCCEGKIESHRGYVWKYRFQDGKDILNEIREKTVEDYKRLIDNALFTIVWYGGFEESHHKQWVLDQVLRTLAGEDYEMWKYRAQQGEEGEEYEYDWDAGIRPE